MIWYYLILFITSLLSIAFDWLPKIEALPTIFGVDTDYYLTLAVGYFYSFIQAFWPLQTLFYGALVFLTYLGIMMIVRLFLGHRSPHV